VNRKARAEKISRTGFELAQQRETVYPSVVDPILYLTFEFRVEKIHLHIPTFSIETLIGVCNISLTYTAAVNQNDEVIVVSC
jgi:hypothetical protein